MAIWTENEVYLGYALLKFVKILTTEKLKGRLKTSPTATLTIHNVEYTGHPLELALLLNYCIITPILALPWPRGDEQLRHLEIDTGVLMALEGLFGHQA